MVFGGVFLGGGVREKWRREERESAWGLRCVAKVLPRSPFTHHHQLTMSGNFMPSRMKNTGMLLPTMSKLPSRV